MNTQLSSVENKLADAYKDLPKIPEGGRKALVNWAPWLALAFGILSLLSALWLYNWAHAANNVINYTNELSRSLGVTSPANEARLTLAVWIGLAVMIVEGVIYLLAFPKLKERLKSGWDLLFLGTLVNLVYGIVIVFTSYSGVSGLIGSLLGTAIGWYFLFQVRSYYSAAAKKK